MRPDILNPLFSEVRSLKGVGPRLTKPLERLKLLKIKDILYHFPYKYVHRLYRETLNVSDVGQNIILKITVIDMRSGHSQRSPLRIIGQDKNGDTVSMIFFGRNAGWAKKQLPMESERIISGKLEQYGDELQIVHPDHIMAVKEADKDQIAISETIENQGPSRIEPIYPLADGITNGRLSQMVQEAFSLAPSLGEWIEPELLKKEKWLDWKESLLALHSDTNEKAWDRLAYDELLANQITMQLVRADMDKRKCLQIHGDGRLTNALKLPFEMTNAQKRTIGEIEGDLIQNRPMLRLLQGDVGSGKTIVALMTLLRCIESGYQAAFLAPTEILARQHYANLQQMLSSLPINIAILTGRDKGKAREATLMGLADGSIDIIIGTHAIFQEAVNYKHLALTVIDEQHKFGVSQRLMLTKKGRGVPHLLVMTATPIPRTLALACYGEMDVSQLDELPSGRSPIETRVMPENRIDEIITGLNRHLSSGKQAFWVCPLIEDNGKSGLAAAEIRAEVLKKHFGDKIGIVHGRMKSEDKDKVMEAFIKKEILLLVATTVIEVGVDVPNASLMIVEAADHFGLAQLHQLRGRVGRGTEKSICLLIRSENLTETAHARLSLMRKSNDGFEIAEEDLNLRGAGEMIGTRQSGGSPFRVASDTQVRALLNIAADDAKLLIQRDGGLTGTRGDAVRILLYLFERDAGVATLRSG